MKRIYLFNIVAWNYRKKIGFPVCKKENFAGLQAHRKRGKSARASPTPHHTLNEERSARFTAQHLSALVTLLAFRLIPSSACNPRKDHWAPVNPGQKPLSALTQLPRGEARGEAIVLQSQARWGHGDALSKIFFRYTVSSILGGQSKPIFITEIFLLLFPFETYVSKTGAQIYRLLVLNYSLSFIFQVPSCWIIFDCTYASSVVVISNIQDYFCLRKRRTIYPITNF